MMLKRTLFLFLACGTGAAAAEDRYFLAGAEGASASYYSYVGVVLPGPGRKDGQGFLQRYWLDKFGYEYDGAPGRVKARATGAEAALGYGVSSPEGNWGAVYLGLRYTDTELTPDDPFANSRGSQTGVKLQVEGERNLATNWRGSGIASYTNEQDSYWVRGRAMYRTSPTLSLGAEALAAGNREADWTSLGAVVGLHSGNTYSIAFKAGYRWQSGENGAYGGVELGVAF
jgi:hypothetical protein